MVLPAKGGKDNIIKIKCTKNIQKRRYKNKHPRTEKKEPQKLRFNCMTCRNPIKFENSLCDWCENKI